MYLIIAVTLMFSAFFSGMEIAYVSANRVQIEIEKKQGNFLSPVLNRLTRRPSKFIATMLIGNNLALVLYGFYMGELLMGHIPVSGGAGLFLHTVISTLIILLTAEFLPKVFFQLYSGRLLKVFAIPAYLFYVLFSLVSELVLWISDLILKLFFKVGSDNVPLNLTKVELGHYITEQMQSVQDDKDKIDSEIQIFQNALQFSNVKAREVMTPRNEIVAVEADTKPHEAARVITETGYSKLPVYRNNVDDIIGYVHAFELFKKPKALREILISVVFIPESTLVKDALNLLTRKRRSIAIVIDEYGGASGMITVEDIVEELFGEIEDEHDHTELIEEQVKSGVFKLSSRLEVTYLNEKYRLHLPESDEYDTLGGLIVSHTEDIPEAGEIVETDGFKFKILEVSETKIETVEMTVL